MAFAGPNSASSKNEISMPDEGTLNPPSDESFPENIAIGSTSVQDPRVKLPETPVGGKAPAATTSVLGHDAFLKSNPAELPPVIARINLTGESAILACNMYGTPVTCLLDSGATHSLISDSQVRKIERITGVKRSGSDVRIDGLYGSPKTALGTFDANLKFGTSRVPQSFLIIDDTSNLSTPVLLGFDFMSQHKVNIDYDAWTATIDNQAYPLLGEKSTVGASALQVRKKLAREFRRELKAVPWLKDSMQDTLCNEDPTEVTSEGEDDDNVCPLTIRLQKEIN